jgi:predicted Rossmann fold flavoprotein
MKHPMVPCFPAITALKPHAYDENLQGILLTNVRMDLWVGGNLVQQEEGEFSFTELGMEGGIAFRSSRRAVRALLNHEKVQVVVDLKPNLTEDQLFARIRREKVAQPKIQVRELLRKMMPKQLVYPFWTAHPGLKEEQIPRALKNWKFVIAEYGSYARAVVTAGGVSLKAVSRKTMESKQVPGLYFVGEVLDLDGDTGGYNLQIAFSTAAAAAEALRKKISAGTC